MIRLLIIMLMSFPGMANNTSDMNWPHKCYDYVSVKRV